MWNEFLPISIPITAGELSSFRDMACSCLWCPLPAFAAGRAGARPDQCSEASCHSSGWKSRQQRSPDTVVVISSDGEGDRSVESLEVKAPVGWETGQIRTGGPAT